MTQETKHMREAVEDTRSSWRYVASFCALCLGISAFVLASQDGTLIHWILWMGACFVGALVGRLLKVRPRRHGETSHSGISFPVIGGVLALSVLLGDRGMTIVLAGLMGAGLTYALKLRSLKVEP